MVQGTRMAPNLAIPGERLRGMYQQMTHASWSQGNTLAGSRSTGSCPGPTNPATGRSSYGFEAATSLSLHGLSAREGCARVEPVESGEMIEVNPTSTFTRGWPGAYSPYGRDVRSKSRTTAHKRRLCLLGRFVSQSQSHKPSSRDFGFNLSNTLPNARRRFLPFI